MSASVSSSTIFPPPNYNALSVFGREQFLSKKMYRKIQKIWRRKNLTFYNDNYNAPFRKAYDELLPRQTRPDVSTHTLFFSQTATLFCFRTCFLEQTFLSVFQFFFDFFIIFSFCFYQFSERFLGLSFIKFLRKLQENSVPFLTLRSTHLG